MTKIRKKNRQRNRRRVARAAAIKKTRISGDKRFIAALIKNEKAKPKPQPHLEWENGRFVPKKPAPSPFVSVSVSVMHEAHKQVGVKFTGRINESSRNIRALADSGCQTCTAGKELLDILDCPESFLVPTSHRIMGITKDSLGIIGALLLRIEVNGEVTRQMVHISEKTRGFYLSESALKDLKMISESFPQNSKKEKLRNQIRVVGFVDHPRANRVSVLDNDDVEEEKCSCFPRSVAPNRPEKIPFDPTPENVPRLKKWMLETFAASAFNTCTHQPLQAMTGAPVEVVFKKGATPHAVHTPIPIPHYWKKKIKQDLDRDVRLGIIEPVPQGTVTRWCSRMVPTAKKNGDPRRTVDLQNVNKATLRETHHTPSPFNLVSSIPAGQLKTVLDAWNGYHSLPLSPKSKDAFTFITEFGRYRYCRAPQGSHTSGDAYTRRFDDITAEHQRKVRCIDDTCLWDQDIESAFWHTFDYIKTCADNGIVFNEEKFQFGLSTVEFAGFEVTSAGFKPSGKTIAAIKEFPTPKNITDIRSWFGLVNQVAYAFAQSQTMAPFREFLSSKTRKFLWDATMDEIFRKSKEEIIRLVNDGVRTFDPSLPTCLTTDWSKMGLGFALTQKHCTCATPDNPNCGHGHWKLILAGSRFTHGPETRYAPIEGECLAAAYGLKQCRMYTLGCPNLTLATDHKPLTRILDDRQLDTICNPRLLKLKERTLMYRFKIVHVAGKSQAMSLADATSRHPTNGYDEDIEEIEAISHAYAVHQGDSIPAVSWRKIKEAAITDEECVSLARLIENGFPERRETLSPDLRRYWAMKDDLYLIDGVPFKDQKMLIPSPLRKIVLEGLHAAHQGVNGMLANARERFFWPGLDASVRLLRSQCRQCNENAPSQAAEPAIPSPQPEYPFQQAVTDLCLLQGHNFLIYADRYSGWVEVSRLSGKSLKYIRECLLGWFMTYGVPEEIASDGGPPYNAFEYDQFLDSWDIRKRLSSAYYSQSNGRAEAAVKSIKRTLTGSINPITGRLDTDAAARAIMTHRNTPTQDTGISPSVALFGRPLRDHLPRKNRNYHEGWQSVKDARESALAKRDLRPEPANTSRVLQPLLVGDSVQVQNQTGNSSRKWHNTGIVTEALPNRQYSVVVDGSRRVTLRNRRFLRKIDPICRKSNALLPAIPDVGEEHPNSPISSRSDNSVPFPLPNSENNPGEMEELEKQNTLPRRSRRERVPREIFSAKLRGKSHDD